MSKYYYLDITLVLSENLDPLLPIIFKGTIERSLQNLFGELSGQTTLDLLKFDPSKNRGIIRIPSDFYVKTRVALTTIRKFREIDCYFKINAASPSLLSLIHTHIDFE